MGTGKIKILFTSSVVKIRLLFLSVVFSLTGFLSVAQPRMMRPQGPVNEFSAIDGTSVLVYNLQAERDISSRAGFGPVFYVFPDVRMDSKQALELVGKLNLIGIAKEYGGRILIVNPSSEKWQDQDLDAFKRFRNNYLY